MTKDQAHLFDMCERSIQRLRRIADLDAPACLIRSEADLLENRLTELRRSVEPNNRECGPCSKWERDAASAEQSGP